MAMKKLRKSRLTKTTNIESSLGIPSIPKDREVLLIGSLEMAAFLAHAVSRCLAICCQKLDLGVHWRTDGPDRVPSLIPYFVLHVLI